MPVLFIASAKEYIDVAYIANRDKRNAIILEEKRNYRHIGPFDLTRVCTLYVCITIKL